MLSEYIKFIGIEGESCDYSPEHRFELFKLHNYSTEVIVENPAPDVWTWYVSVMGYEFEKQWNPKRYIGLPTWKLVLEAIRDDCEWTSDFLKDKSWDALLSTSDNLAIRELLKEARKEKDAV
jgi:hypothetical protein